MSLIKSHSTVTKKMAHWNLYDYFNHYDILIRDYVATTSTEIEKVIMHGDGWCTKFVGDWMDMSNKKSSKILICHTNENFIHTQRELKGTLYTTKIKEFYRTKKKVPKSTMMYLSQKTKNYSLVVHVMDIVHIGYHVFILPEYTLN